MPLDLTKPVQTRGGLKARIIATDLKRTFLGQDEPIAAAITEDCHGEMVRHFSIEGRYLAGSTGDYDLVNVPEPLGDKLCAELDKTVNGMLATRCGPGAEAVIGRYSLVLADIRERLNKLTE